MAARSTKRVSRLSRLTKRLGFRRLQLIILVLTFVLVGVAVIFVSRAATPSRIIDVATGLLTGNARLVADQSAAGGSAIQFGNSPAPKPSFHGPLDRQVVTDTILVSAHVDNYVSGQPVELWLNDSTKLGNMSPSQFDWIFALNTVPYGVATAHLNVVTYDDKGVSYRSPNQAIFIVNNPAAPTSNITFFDSIPADCSRDVTQDITSFVNYFGGNHTYNFKANGCYQVNGHLDFSGLSNVAFEGNGATIKVMTDGSEFCPPTNLQCSAKRGRHQWQFLNSSNIRFHNLIMRGANPINGSQGGAYRSDYEAQNLWEFGSGVVGATLDNVQGYNPYGDFVFISAASNVVVKNSNFDSDGRQGFAVEHGTNILVQNNKIADTRRSVVDIEPAANGPILQNFTLANNEVTNGYGGFNFLSNFGYGSAMDNILVLNNHMHKHIFNVHVQNCLKRSDPPFAPCSPRTNYRIIGNSSDLGVDQSGGGAIYFAGVTGLEVRGNNYPMTPTRSISGVGVDDVKHAWVTDNTFGGASGSVWFYPFADALGPSSDVCWSDNNIGLPTHSETSTTPCSGSFVFQ